VTQGSVLIVDDDSAFRFATRKALTRLGYAVSEAQSGEEALSALARSEPPDAALLDLRMEGIDGLTVLRRRGSCTTRIIVLTGHGTVQAAVDAMRLGAYSFLEKSFGPDVLHPLLAQAVAESQRARSGKDSTAPRIVGTSPAIEQVRRFIARVGPTDETVAIYGETGTGKEVVAQHLHLASPRARRPFVALNAACVPRELFESELFGHKKGAFTGATADRSGLFRDANGGTLFIDELGELPLDSQAKLLRALETRQIRTVGDNKETAVDVRILAATNRDLLAEVRAGRFREDLYYRLQVLPVVLPPLRARLDDIFPLAEDLMQRVTSQPRVFTPDARTALESYDWPGNVRELLNVLRRVSLFAEGEAIDGALVRRMISASVFAQAHAERQEQRVMPTPLRAPEPIPHDLPAKPTVTNLADVERQHIESVLQSMDHNITRTAIALGIDRRTLQRKLRAYGYAATGDD
jgi:two-component system nitrogen regulation response regulator NtrX